MLCILIDANVVVNSVCPMVIHGKEKKKSPPFFAHFMYLILFIVSTVELLSGEYQSF